MHATINTHTNYLTGVDNETIRQAAETDLYGKLGVMIQPGTLRYAKRLESYSSWALDNGCFSSRGEFDGDTFVRELERIIETENDAAEKCLFAVAPDVFDPAAGRGYAVETLERSAAWYDRIRNAGRPVALVAQDGLEAIADEIPWPEFDVLFIGGSDQFKLGYPTRVVSGNPHYSRDPVSGELFDERTTNFMRMIERAHIEGKGIHVGRVSSDIRLAYSYAIGAESADGTFLKRAGAVDGTERIRQWYRDDSFNLADELELDLGVVARPIAA